MVKRSKAVPLEVRAAIQLRIPGIAVGAWAILEAAGALVAVWLDSQGVADLGVGVTFTLILLLSLYVLFGLKVADQWEKAIVLRFGRFRGLRGPGMFWVIPIVDRIPIWIDHRVMVTPFSAEKTPLEVEDYRAAIAWAAQTALREVIGQMSLADILVGRARMDQDLQKIIDERTTPWGVTVQSVEIRDVVIPQDLEDAMSRQAQAERERQARVILGESERQIAQSFADASLAYQGNPTALHLRAMNMLFEGLKEKGALVIVPSSAVDTMNLGAMSGLVSIAQNNIPKDEKK